MILSFVIVILTSGEKPNTWYWGYFIGFWEKDFSDTRRLESLILTSTCYFFLFRDLLVLGEVRRSGIDE